MSKFCIRPFTHITIFTDGNYSPCWNIGPLGDKSTHNSTLEEYWNSDIVRDLRKQFINGEQPEACSNCWNTENNGGFSPRMGNASQAHTYHDVVMSEINSDFKMPNKIRKIELRASNLCNLSCNMCSPVASSSWFKLRDKVSDIIPVDITTDTIVSAYTNIEHIKKDMKPFIDDLEYICINGGESLYDPLNYEFLKSLTKKQKSKIKCTMITNLNVVSSPLLNSDIFDGFKHFIICASIDGTPEVNDYIRQGSNFDKIRQSWEIVKSRDDHPSMDILMSIQGLSAIRLDDTLDMFLTEFKPGNIDFGIVDVDYLHVSMLPVAIKNDIIKRLTHYKTVKINKFETSIELRNSIINICNTVISLCKIDTHDTQWDTFVKFNIGIYGSLDKLKRVFPELIGWL